MQRARSCVVRISRSPIAGKKWVARGVVTQRRSSEGTPNEAAPALFTVHFGATGYQDYTQHKDEARMRNYLVRHRAREDWTARGLRTAGFWSRWLLWNKPSLRASAADISRRFGVRVILSRSP
jgi:hypothetical protein